MVLGKWKVNSQWDTYFIAIRISKIESFIIPNVGEDMELPEISYIFGGCEMVKKSKQQQKFRKQWGSFLTKLNIYVPYSQDFYP